MAQLAVRNLTASRLVFRAVPAAGVGPVRLRELADFPTSLLMRTAAPYGEFYFLVLLVGPLGCEVAAG